MFTHSACKKMIISDNTPEVKWDMWKKQYMNNINNINNMNNMNNNSRIMNVHEYINNLPLPPIRSTPVRGEGWEY
jgi:superoxide dismutase